MTGREHSQTTDHRELQLEVWKEITMQNPCLLQVIFFILTSAGHVKTDKSNVQSSQLQL